MGNEESRIGVFVGFGYVFGGMGFQRKSGMARSSRRRSSLEGKR
jgi:hypothetical protein